MPMAWSSSSPCALQCVAKSKNEVYLQRSDADKQLPGRFGVVRWPISSA